MKKKPYEGMPLPSFSVDAFGWVIATLADGGMLKDQSVKALLLLAILRKLEEQDPA